MAFYNDSATARDARSVTPHDTDLVVNGVCRALYIGVSGDVKITTADDTDVTFKAVPVGVLTVQAKRVWATGTTATDIVALY